MQLMSYASRRRNGSGHTRSMAQIISIPAVLHSTTTATRCLHTPTTNPVATPTKEPTDSGDTPTTSPVAMPTKELTDDPSDDSREEDGFYDCDAMNPCGVQENIDADKFYFPSSDPAKYIQCGMSSDMCFVKDCGPGTHWDQEQLVCGWAGMNLYYSLLCSAGITSMCEYNN